MSTAAFILSIIGLIAWYIPFLGYPINIISLILAIKSRKIEKDKLSTYALILSILGLIFTIMFSIICIVSYIMVNNYNGK